MRNAAGGRWRDGAPKWRTEVMAVSRPLSAMSRRLTYPSRPIFPPW